MKPLEKAVFKVIKRGLIRNNGDILNTCKDLGIPKRTLYNYRQRWPELEDYIKYRKEEIDTSIEGDKGYERETSNT